ncbi:MAG: TetR/AcrR family transcriptional regulator [Treponema sp.]|nr:TetR/AcrR family transcriptional regulator [Treponema sp.]
MEEESTNITDSSESTKEQILALAIKLFASKGYGSVGIQEIVTEAGISKPTLYYHFGSKKGLLEAIIKEKAEPLCQDIEQAAEYKHDFIAGLKEILTTMINYAKKDPDFFRLHCILSNAPDNSEEIKLYLGITQRIMSAISGFFIESTSEFGNMRGKEALYSITFYANVTAQAMFAARDTLPVTDETLHWIVHSFVYGVANG